MQRARLTEAPVRALIAVGRSPRKTDWRLARDSGRAAAGGIPAELPTALTHQPSSKTSRDPTAAGLMVSPGDEIIMAAGTASNRESAPNGKRYGRGSGHSGPLP